MRSRDKQRLNPIQARRPSLKSGRHRIDQHREGSPSLNSARLAQAEDAFNPVVTNFTGGSETSLAPEHPESQRPLREVVRRLNAGLLEEQPQMLYLTFQVTDQPTCGILALAVDRNQAMESRDERPPFADGRRGFGHMAQPPKFVSRPGSTLGQGGVFALGQPLSLADQVRQTGLSQPHPLAIHGVTVGD